MNGNVSVLVFTDVITNAPNVVSRSVRRIGRNRVGLVILFVFMLLNVTIATNVICVRHTRHHMPMGCTRGRRRNHGVCTRRRSRLPLGLGVTKIVPTVFTDSLLLFPTDLKR